MVAKIGKSENLFLCGNFNSHIGSIPIGWNTGHIGSVPAVIHSGYGYGELNPDGERITEFPSAI